MTERKIKVELTSTSFKERFHLKLYTNLPGCIVYYIRQSRVSTSNICFPEFPYFLAKPSPSVTVLEKENVTLPCKVAGFPQPVIKWYKDDHVIKGERRQFLEIKEILFEDRGNYTCTAENLLGRARLSFNVTVKG